MPWMSVRHSSARGGPGGGLNAGRLRHRGGKLGKPGQRGGGGLGGQIGRQGGGSLVGNGPQAPGTGQAAASTWANTLSNSSAVWATHTWAKVGQIGLASGHSRGVRAGPCPTGR